MDPRKRENKDELTERVLKSREVFKNCFNRTNNNKISYWNCPSAMDVWRACAKYFSEMPR
jgi:hypothetical protein